MIFRHKSIEVLEFRKEFIYSIVADVNNYPNFIPWISRVKELSSYDNTIEYELEVNFKLAKETFSTKDVFYAPDKIEISLLRGPFKFLNNNWIFKEISPNVTEVIFEIEFEFKSKIMSVLFSKLFIQAQKEIFKAFQKRAKELTLQIK